MEHSFIDQEAGLVPQVQVSYDPLLAALLQVGLVLVTAALTATPLGPGPGNFDAVAVALSLVTRDFHAFRQVDVDGDAGHGRPWQRVPPAACSAGRPFQLSTIENSCRRGNPRNPCVLHLKAEEPQNFRKQFSAKIGGDGYEAQID